MLKFSTLAMASFAWLIANVMLQEAVTPESTIDNADKLANGANPVFALGDDGETIGMFSKSEMKMKSIFGDWEVVVGPFPYTGIVENMKADYDIVAFQYKHTSGTTHRLYFATVGKQFQPKSYKVWSDKLTLLGIASMGTNRGVVLLYRDTVLGKSFLEFNPLQDGIYYSEKSLTYDLQTFEPIYIASGLNTQTLVVASTTSFMRFAVSKTALTTVAAINAFPGPITSMLAFPRYRAAPPLSDIFYAVQGNSVLQMVVNSTEVSLSTLITVDNLLSISQMATSRLAKQPFIVLYLSDNSVKVIDAFQNIVNSYNIGLTGVNGLWVAYRSNKLEVILSQDIDANTYKLSFYSITNVNPRCNDGFAVDKCYSSCKTGFYYFQTATNPQTETSVGTCLDKAEFSPSFGVNQDGLNVVSCQVSNCYSCADDYRVCTNCTSPQGLTFYLVSTSVSVYPYCTGLIPEGYGVVLSQPVKELKMCTVPNCVDCKADNTKCVSCDTNTYLLVETGTCYEYSAIPESRGIVKGSNNLEPCVDLACADCKSDRMVCSSCLVPSGFWLKSEEKGQSCADPNTPIDMYGKDLINSKIVKCAEQNCLKCFDNYQICEQCAVGYLKGTIGGIVKCLTQKQLPLMYGVDENLTFSQCSNNCVACFTNKSICEMCTGSTYLYEKQTETVCLSVNDVKALAGEERKYGINGDRFQKCINNCSECFDNAAECSVCEGGFYLFKGPFGHQCLDTITSGLGINKTTNQLEPCQQYNCKNCSADITICTECKDKIYYSGVPQPIDPISGSTIGTPFQCTQATSIPPNYGKDISTSVLELKKCTFTSNEDLNCLNCEENYKKCTKCQTSLYIQYDEASNSYGCVTQGNIYPGYGIEPVNIDIGPASQLLLKCSVNFCNSCFTDYKICEGCVPNYYLDATLKRKGGQITCQTMNTVNVDPDYSGAGVDVTSKTIVSCQTINCASCGLDFKVCTRCNPSYYLDTVTVPGTITCMNNVPDKDGFGKKNQSGLLIISQCSDQNCLNCYANFADCKKCKQDWYLYVDEADQFGKCVEGVTSSFPPGYGIVLTAPPDNLTLAKCSIQNCNSTGCLENFANCTKCKTDFWMQLAPDALTPNRCVAANNPILEFGIDSSGPSPVLRRCLFYDLGCRSCYADFKICIGCDTNLLLNVTNTSNSEGICKSPGNYSGYGVNPQNSSQIGTCKLQGCEYCSENFSDCEYCSAGLYLDKVTVQSVTICREATENFVGAGKDPSTMTIKRCSDFSCQNCSLYDQCTQCSEGYALNSLLGGSPKCISKDALPDGYGYTDQNDLATCSDTVNCIKCRQINNCVQCKQKFFVTGDGCQSCPSNCDVCSNGTFCTTCESGFYLIIQGETSSCQSSSTPGYGRNGTNPGLIPCSDPNCMDCFANYENCITCKTGFSILKTSELQSCVNTSAVPLGIGLSDDGLSYEKCKIAGCANCTTNSSDCSRCIWATMPVYYLLVDGNQKKCLTRAQIPLGYGIDVLNPVMVLTQCIGNSGSADPCLNCSQNFRVCSLCKTNWVVQAQGDGTTKCIESNFTDGYGKNLTTGLLVRCKADLCKDCYDNYLLCSKCYDGSYKLPAAVSVSGEDECLRFDQIPIRNGAKPGFGINITEANQANTSSLQPCSDSSRCMNCSLGYNYCMNCSDNLFMLPVAKPSLSTSMIIYSLAGQKQFYSCLDPSVIIPSGYGKETGSNILKECAASNCADCSVNFQTCQSCKSAYFMTPEGICITTSQLALLPRFGKQRDATTGLVNSQLISQCSDPNCQWCTEWNRVCAVCVPNKYLKVDLIDSTKNTCVSSDDLLNTMTGPKLTESVIKVLPCLNSRCMDCHNDYSNCTACKTDYFYMFNSQTQTLDCFTEQEVLTLEARVGIQAGSKQLAECIAECLKCNQNSSTCTVCKNPARFLFASSPPDQPKCVDPTTLPPTQENGLDLKNKLIRSCLASNCLDCWEDYSKCKACKSSFYLNPASNVETNRCVESSNIPNGFGVVSGAQKASIESCRTEGCKVCAINSQICQQCQDGYFGKVTSSVPATFSKCFNSLQQVVEPLGLEVGTTDLKNCTTGCNTCKQNYLNCTECLPTFFFWEDTCRASDASPPTGYGKDTMGSFLTYKRCSANCSVCSENYLICQTCNSGYVVKNGLCEQETSFRLGYGLNGSDLVPCDLSTCKNCTNDYRICHECYNGLGLFTNGTNQSCLSAIEIPPRMGFSGLLVANCSTEHCQDCTVNATVCQLCEEGYYLLTEGNNIKCLSMDQIPEGMGVRGKNITDCQDSMCKNCSRSFTTCYECKAGYYSDPFSTDPRCINSSFNLNTTQLSNFVKNEGVENIENQKGKALSTVRFSVNISEVKRDQVTCLAFFKENGTIISDFNLKKFNIGKDDKSLIVELGFPKTVTGVSALFRTVERNIPSAIGRVLLSSENNPFTNGVLVDDLEYYSSDSVDFLRGASLFLSITFMVVSAVTALKNDLLAFKMIDAAVLIGMLRFWSSDQPVYFVEIISWFDLNLLNVVPFVKISEETIKCTPPMTLESVGASCFVYNNIHRYLSTFVCFLILAALMYICFSKEGVRNQKKNHSRPFPLDSSVGTKKRWSIPVKSFVFQWICSTLLPICYFSWINIYTANRASGMKYGYAVAVGLLLTYLSLIVLCAFKMRSYHYEHENKEDRFFRALFLQSREVENTRVIVRYTFVFKLLFNYLLALFLALLLNYPLTQSIVVTIMLLMAFLWTLVMRPYITSQLNNYVMLVDLVILIASVLLLILVPSLGVDSVRTRQMALGFCLLFCPCILVFTSIFTTLQTLITAPKRKVGPTHTSASHQSAHPVQLSDREDYNSHNEKDLRKSRKDD